MGFGSSFIPLMVTGAALIAAGIIAYILWKTRNNYFSNQLLATYLPLLAIFITGASTILLPLGFRTFGSLTGIGWPLFLVEIVCISLYFILLHVYSSSVGKDSKHMFLATLVGSIIIAAGFYQIYAGSVNYAFACIVVALIYIGFLSHKKWV